MMVAIAVPEVNFEFNDDLVELQQLCRRIAKVKVAPRAREIDKTGEYPHDLLEVFRDAGLFGLCIPKSMVARARGSLD